MDVLFKAKANSLLHLGESGRAIYNRNEDIAQDHRMERFLRRAEDLEYQIYEAKKTEPIPMLYEHLRLTVADEKQKNTNQEPYLHSAVVTETYFPNFMQVLHGSVTLIDEYLPDWSGIHKMNEKYPTIKQSFVEQLPHGSIGNVEIWCLQPKNGQQQFLVGRLYKGNEQNKEIRAGIIIEVLFGNDTTEIYVQSLTIYTTGYWMFKVVEVEKDLAPLIDNIWMLREKPVRRYTEMVGNVFGAGIIPGFKVIAHIDPMEQDYRLIHSYTRDSWKGNQVLINTSCFHPRGFFCPYIALKFRDDYNVKFVRTCHLKRNISFVKTSLHLLKADWMTNIDSHPTVNAPFVPRTLNLNSKPDDKTRPAKFALALPAAQLQGTNMIWKATATTEKMLPNLLNDDTWSKLEKAEYDADGKIPIDFFFDRSFQKSVEDDYEDVSDKPGPQLAKRHSLDEYQQLQMDTETIQEESDLGMPKSTDVPVLISTDDEQEDDEETGNAPTPFSVHEDLMTGLLTTNFKDKNESDQFQTQMGPIMVEKLHRIESTSGPSTSKQFLPTEQPPFESTNLPGTSSQYFPTVQPQWSQPEELREENPEQHAILSEKAFLLFKTLSANMLQNNYKTKEDLINFLLGED